MPDLRELLLDNQTQYEALREVLRGLRAEYAAKITACPVYGGGEFNMQLEGPLSKFGREGVDSRIDRVLSVRVAFDMDRIGTPIEAPDAYAVKVLKALTVASAEPPRTLWTGARFKGRLEETVHGLLLDVVRCINMKPPLFCTQPELYLNRTAYMGDAFAWCTVLWQEPPYVRTVPATFPEEKNTLGQDVVLRQRM